MTQEVFEAPLIFRIEIAQGKGSKPSTCFSHMKDQTRLQLVLFLPLRCFHGPGIELCGFLQKTKHFLFPDGSTRVLIFLLKPIFHGLDNYFLGVKVTFSPRMPKDGIIVGGRGFKGL